MPFNSFTFLAFFTVVFILYFLTPIKTRWLILLGASIFFFMSFNPAYIVLILCTVSVSYSAARLIEYTDIRWKRRLLLVLSFFVCFDLLVMFKYYNFFSGLVNDILKRSGGTPVLPLISLLLPAGISFYTFQCVSYVVDVYRGNFKAERNPIYFALYVMFFPKLVSGPIERAGDLLPQFHNPRRFEYKRAIMGCHLIIWGLFKKCVIADSLCIAVNNVYENIAMQSSISAIIGTVFFAFQIYCDFSGYSDIAVGTAKILGYDLTLNFNNPYIAKNIDEFWSRWHITLSTWLRDYLYIPLGGSRCGKFRMNINLFLTFLISGLWHGANLTFIIWGAFHGILTVIYKLIKKPLKVLSVRVANKFFGFTVNTVSRIFTFILVCFGWIFFRANSVSDAKAIISKIFASSGAGFADSFASMGIDTSVLTFICVSVVFMYVIEYFRCEHGLFEKFANEPVFIRTPVCLILSVVIMFVLVYFSGGEVKPFVYSQF